MKALVWGGLLCASLAVAGPQKIDGKQLTVLFTGDTGGEVAPCG